MKRVLLALIIISGFFTWYACEKEEPTAIINTDEAVAPSLTSPADGSSIVLIKDTANPDFTPFTWSAADYGMASLANVNYTLSMIYVDSSVTETRTLAATNELTAEFTVDDMNTKLLELGLNTDEMDTVQFQVTSSITADTDEDNLSSDIITLYLTPFLDSSGGGGGEIIDKAIYLLGGATEAGWDNMTDLAMTQITAGRYVIVAELNTDGDGWFKFLSVRGQWAPQWGTDETGTFEGGPLVYRPTEDDTDPPAIPMGDETGTYRLVADTVALTYTTEAYEVVDPLPSELYLVGEATTVGWDNSIGIPFTQDSAGYFSLVTDLTAGGGGMKILNLLNNWAPQWGTSAGANPEGDLLIYRPTEDITDPAEIPAPATSGTYKISVNFHIGIYQITAQ